MNVSATLDGVSVTIVSINIDGGNMFITYSQSGTLKVKKVAIRLNSSTATQTIATAATVN